MKFEILKLVIWPKNQKFAPRVIDFKPGAINVITGQSGSGKSSLTSIIDYSLGCKKCTIPVGTIRNFSQWYGVLIQTSYGELLMARKDPGDNHGTDDMYWSLGSNIDIPQILEKNISRSDAISILNDRCGLARALEEDYTYRSSCASFRDMSAFNFQPQHIIANPHTLFFKTDTPEHREKLKSIFPLVLDVINNDSLIEQRRKSLLMKEAKDLNIKIDILRDKSERILKEVIAYYKEADYLGLIDENNRVDGQFKIDELLRVLRCVLNDIENEYIPPNTPSLSNSCADRYRQVLDEELSLQSQIGNLKRREIELVNIADVSSTYNQALENQQERLKSVGWLKKKLTNLTQCPFCKAEHGDINENVQSLYRLAEQFSSLSNQVKRAPLLINNDIQELREEISRLETEMSDYTAERISLEKIREEHARFWKRNDQLHFFAGKLTAALGTLKAYDDSEARKQLRAVQDDISKIDANIENQRKRQELIEQIVSSKMQSYAKLLELEHSSASLSLYTKELTLLLDGHYLSEIGSGQNWVGYHIAAMLALHEYFLSVPSSPVPSFLLLDQPSQVYFPEDIHKPLNKSQDKTYVSLDVQGVQRIFSTLSKFMEKTNNNFQIIVVEHAGDYAWKDVQNIFIVGNWRQGNDDFLIPKEWIESAGNDNRSNERSMPR